MAVYLAVAGDVFDGDFCDAGDVLHCVLISTVLYPTRCLGRDLGLN